MPKSKAQQALAFVKEIAPKCDTATDLHNAFWGIGGKLGQLLTTREEREAFMNTPEYTEIAKIRDSLKWYWDQPKSKKRASRGRANR